MIGASKSINAGSRKARPSSALVSVYSKDPDKLSLSEWSPKRVVLRKLRWKFHYITIPVNDLQGIIQVPSPCDSPQQMYHR